MIMCKSTDLDLIGLITWKHCTWLSCFVRGCLDLYMVVSLLVFDWVDDLYLDVLTRTWMSWFVLGCLDLYLDVLTGTCMHTDVLTCSWVSWLVLRCLHLYLDVLKCALMSWLALGCLDLYSGVLTLYLDLLTCIWMSFGPSFCWNWDTYYCITGKFRNMKISRNWTNG